MDKSTMTEQQTEKECGNCHRTFPIEEFRFKIKFPEERINSCTNCGHNSLKRIYNNKIKSENQEEKKSPSDKIKCEYCDSSFQLKYLKLHEKTKTHITNVERKINPTKFRFLEFGDSMQ